jgi:hypothetical protein
MTLAYADAHLPAPKPRSRSSMWGGIVLTLLFIPTASLCFRAIRWDRWANYESNDRRLWKNLPGESYAWYKAWHAWRKSWERTSIAAAISGAGLIVAGGLLAHSRLRGTALSRWLVIAIVLHGLVVAYFVLQWGPDFRHPYPTWTG